MTVHSAASGTSRSTGSIAGSSVPNLPCSRTSAGSPRRAAASAGALMIPRRSTRPSPRPWTPTAGGCRWCWTSASPVSGCGRPASTTRTTPTRATRCCDTARHVQFPGARASPGPPFTYEQRCQMLVDFGQPLGGVVQFAYTVPDIEEATRAYTARLRGGPWFVRRPFRPLEGVYRGQPCDARRPLARACPGQPVIELIEQHDNAPSVFLERIEATGYGFHHWGVPSAAPGADL